MRLGKRSQRVRRSSSSIAIRVIAEREWEDVLRRLEDTGFAVDPVEQGAVVFETGGVERLYGGVQPALERARGGRAHVGSAHRRCGKAFHRARGGERVARPGQILLVAAKEEEAFLEPLPLSLLPMTPNHYAEPRRARAALGEPVEAARRCGCRAARSGGERRLATGSRRPQGACARTQARLGARRGAHLSRGDRERDHAATGARLSPRASARASRTGRAAVSKASRYAARLVDGGSWRRW